MQHIRSARRGLLLALTLLSACAAADPSPSRVAARAGHDAPSGVFGEFLTGRFAMSQADAQTAATQFLRALAARPDDTELLQQAFIASLVAGRSEAVQLARAAAGQPGGAASAGPGGGARRPLAGGGAALPRAAAPGPDAAPAAAAGRLVAAGRRPNRRGAGHAASVHRRPAVPRRLRAARRADRRPGRPRGGGRETVSPGADRIRRHEPAPRADPGERAGAPRPSRRGAAHPRRAGRRCAGYGHRPAGADRRQHDPAGAARDRTGSPRPISRSRPPCARRTPATSPCCCCAWRSTCGPTSPPRGCWRPTSWKASATSRTPCRCSRAVAGDDPLIAVVRLQRAALTERLGHSEEAMHAMQRIARDYPDSPIPAMREGDLLRAKQRFAEAIGAYDRAIARIKTPGPTDWLVYLRSRHLLRAFAPVDQGGGGFQARADARPGSALRAELPRLLLGRHGPEPGAGADDDRQGGAAPAERRRHRRQPGLGDAAPGRRRRSGAARWSARSNWIRRMRRSTAISATPTGRPGASWRRPISGAAR